MASSCKFVNYMSSFHFAYPKLIVQLELLVVEPLQEIDPRRNNTSVVFILPSLGLRLYVKSCPPPPHRRALSFFLICLKFFSYFLYKYYEGGFQFHFLLQCNGCNIHNLNYYSKLIELFNFRIQLPKSYFEQCLIGWVQVKYIHVAPHKVGK